MIQLTYAGMDFKVLKTEQWQVRPIMTPDGQDYVCSEVTVEVVATLNPRATSFMQDAGGFNVPGGALFAVKTEANIRHALAQPRQLLQIKGMGGAGTTMLLSPPIDSRTNLLLPCDVKGGPYCEVLGNPKIHSDRTWEYHLRFKTYIRECATPKLILGHRWTQSINVDEDGFEVIATVGKVTVDLGQITFRRVQPDLFRNLFFFPVPRGFKRKVQVSQSSDGSELNYHVVDTQMGIGYDGATAQRIEIVQQGGWAQQGTFRAIGSVFGAAANAAVSAAFGGGVSPGAAGASAGTMALADALGSTLPQYTTHITVRCWGSPTSRREELTALAMAIAFQRVGFPRDQYTNAFQLTEGVTQKFSEVQLTTSIGFNVGLREPRVNHKAMELVDQFRGVAGMDQNFSAIFNNVLANFSPAEGFFVDVPGVGLTSIGPGLSLPPPPGDGISAGTALTTLLFQTLTGPCQSPAPVNNLARSLP